MREEREREGGRERESRQTDRQVGSLLMYQ